MPAGACDTHFHIFPAGHEHRYVTDRSYTPPALEISDFDNIARSLRIERAVVVQASVYGANRSCDLKLVALLIQCRGLLLGHGKSSASCHSSRKSCFSIA